MLQAFIAAAFRRLVLAAKVCFHFTPASVQGTIEAPPCDEMAVRPEGPSKCNGDGVLPAMSG